MCPSTPTGSPRSFRPVDAGVGSVVMAVLEAEPMVVIAGSWCGPEGAVLGGLGIAKDNSQLMMGSVR